MPISRRPTFPRRPRVGRFVLRVSRTVTRNGEVLGLRLFTEYAVIISLKIFSDFVPQIKYVPQVLRAL